MVTTFVLLFLFLFLSGCTEPDTILVRTGSSSGSDTNKVAVSSTDTNANYLFSKLAAGTNITLSILNPGANERVQISAPSGAGGKTYTSGTPATIQVNNDNNTISQNFDGNFTSRINALDLNNSLNYSKVNCDNNSNCTLTGKITTTRDINANNIKFSGTLSGGDFNYSLSDANGSQSCPGGQALQSVGSSTSCVSITSTGGSGTTYTSGTPATIQVNNDLNTISQNYDGNFWARFTPANDGNFYTKFSSNYDSNFWSRFTPANDGNFYVKFQTNFDSNFWVRFSPAYDGNFWLRFTPANDGNFYTRFSANFDSNFWARFNPASDANIYTKITATFDSNFWTRFTSANDGNYFTRFQTNFDGNFTSHINALDLNNSLNYSKTNCDNNSLCTFTGKITTTKDINAQNIKFNGTLSGGDFNYSLDDANGSQTASAGSALSSVGSTVTSIAIPPSLGSCDNNASCTLTGKITTTKDINAQNIKFSGTLSGGDFNYSLSDANGSQSCPAGQVLSSVGATSTCVPKSLASDGNGSILGTTNQVNVTNGLSRLFGDSNVVLSLPQSIDTGSSVEFATLLLSLGASNCLTITDSVGSNVFKIDCSVKKVYSRDLVPLFATNDLGSTTERWRKLWVQTIDSNVDANFNNIKFKGTLSGGDFNYSLIDANGSQTASAGSALSSVGATVTSIPIPPSLGSCDNNTSCTLTGKITTTQDVNARNGLFRGTLSADDFNFSIGDANDSQVCSANQALNSVGPSKLCIGVPENSNDIIGTTNQITVVNGIGQVSNGNITLSLPQNIARSSNVEFNNLRIDTNAQIDANLHIGKNLLQDGNIVFNDANDTSIGSDTNYGNTINFWNFNCKASNYSACMSVPANTTIFSAGGSIGMDFNNTGKAIDTRTTATGVILYRWGFGGASATGLSYMIPNTNANPTFPSSPRLNGTYYMFDNGTVIIPKFYSSGGFHTYGEYQPNDLNVDGNVTVKNNIYGQVMSVVANVGTTCTTACDGFDNFPGTANWSCIAADSLAGITSTCGDNLIQKNCLCKD